MFPDDSDVSENMGIFLDRALPTLEGMEASTLNRAASTLKRLGPQWVFNALWRPIVANMLKRKETFTCPLMTVSQIIVDQVNCQYCPTRERNVHLACREAESGDAFPQMPFPNQFDGAKMSCCKMVVYMAFHMCVLGSKAADIPAGAGAC